YQCKLRLDDSPFKGRAHTDCAESASWNNSENYTTHVLELPEGLIECDKLKLCGPSKCGEVRVSREFWGRRVDVRVVALLLFQAIWFIRQMHSRIVQDPVVQTPTFSQ